MRWRAGPEGAPNPRTQRTPVSVVVALLLGLVLVVLPATPFDSMQAAHASTTAGDAAFMQGPDGTNLPRVDAPVVTAGDLVFSTLVAGSPCLCLRDASTGNLTVLASGSGDASPDVSPDGSRVAYAAGYMGRSPATYAIWVMNSDGSNKTQVSQYPNDGNGWSDGYPKWSPDGRRFCFRGMKAPLTRRTST